LSVVRLKGGPGRSLGTGTYVGSSDGPWKRLKFRVGKLRRDFQRTLINGDVKTLVSTAQELLRDPNVVKSRGFWEIFSKRVEASVHLLSPLDAATICSSFDKCDKATSLYSTCATTVPRMKKPFSGTAIKMLIQVLSKRTPDNKSVMKFLTQRVPDAMYQLSVDDIVVILQALKGMDYTSELVCGRMMSKVATQFGELDSRTIGVVSEVASAHRYRNLDFFSALERRGTDIVHQFEGESLLKFLVGFNRLSIDCPKFLKAAKPRIASLCQTFTKDQLESLHTLLEDSNYTE